MSTDCFPPDPHFVLITLDSVGYEVFERAAFSPFSCGLLQEMRQVLLPGRSHGDSTLPAHAAMFAGFLPRIADGQQVALPALEAREAPIPCKRSLYAPCLPAGFRTRGYRTACLWSLWTLHPSFGLTRGFDIYLKPAMEREPDSLIIDLEENLERARDIRDHCDGPVFLVLNIGETHLPYRHKGQKPIPEAEGIPDFLTRDGSWHFTPAEQRALSRLKLEQSAQIHWVFERLERFASRFKWFSPENAVWYVTADHGELFGEHNRYGHGHGGFPEEMLVPVMCNNWGFIDRLVR